MPQEEVWGHPPSSARRLLDPETRAQSRHHRRRHWHLDFPLDFLLAWPRHHLELKTPVAAQVVDRVAARLVAILAVRQEGQLHVEPVWWPMLLPHSVCYQIQETQSIATGGRASHQQDLRTIPTSALCAVTMLAVWPPALVQAHRKTDTSSQRMLKSQLVMVS